jgi:5-methylcytosine-specific restriction endonuclease McrA
VPKPDSEKRPRRKANTDLLQNVDEAKRTYCWRCLRTSVVLKSLRPPLGLEVHHVIEVADGGSNETDNLQVLCAECHEETHRDRRRYARYLANVETKETSDEKSTEWPF